jgi:hypothetical protein
METTPRRRRTEVELGVADGRQDPKQAVVAIDDQSRVTTKAIDMQPAVDMEEGEFVHGTHRRRDTGKNKSQPIQRAGDSLEHQPVDPQVKSPPWPGSISSTDQTCHQDTQTDGYRLVSSTHGQRDSWRVIIRPNQVSRQGPLQWLIFSSPDADECATQMSGMRQK